MKIKEEIKCLLQAKKRNDEIERCLSIYEKLFEFKTYKVSFLDRFINRENQKINTDLTIHFCKISAPHVRLDLNITCDEIIDALLLYYEKIIEEISIKKEQ